MELICDMHNSKRAKAYPETGFISIKEGNFREIIYLPPGGNMVIHVEGCFTYIERTESGRFISTSCDDKSPARLSRYFSGLMDQYCPKEKPRNTK